MTAAISMDTDRGVPDLLAIEGYLETVLASPNGGSSDITLGIEHEFFIEVQGLPATQDHSQQLFCALRNAGWTIKSEADFGTGQIIAAQSPPYCSRTELKYEHHPFLLEVAFHFDNSLTRIEALLTAVFRDIDQAATQAGVEVRHQPFCCVPSDHPGTMSHSPMAIALKEYRRQLLQQRGQTASAGLLNFSAVIAATQVHVGGLNWWTDNALVNRLYSFETSILPWAYKNISDREDSRLKAMQRRWHGYREMLRGLPLVGYPDLERWDRKGWIQAMHRSPLIGRSGQNPEEFLYNVRDLQIIRPRVFGTLEFRADPAQSSVTHIMALAALRLGCCLAALNGEYLPGTFRDHYRRWWGHVAGERSSDAIAHSVSMLTIAGRYLMSRGDGDARFLDSFHEAQSPVSIA